MTMRPIYRVFNLRNGFVLTRKEINSRNWANRDNYPSSHFHRFLTIALALQDGNAYKEGTVWHLTILGRHALKRAFVFALFTAILAGGICSAQTSNASAPAFAAHPSPYNFPGVQYPRIEADSRVTFHFKAPNAQKVQVSIVNVPFDMVKGDDGVWTYTSEPQAPGYHNYWMLVDGAIVLDPGTNAFIGYGHMCNGFEVPDPGVDFMS
jgi:hypothetical protein